MFQIFSKKHKGYTLVEILAVIGIMGILIGIVLVALGPAKKQGREARITSDLYELQNWAEQIYLEEGNYDKLSIAPEVLALSSDISAQGSSLKIYKPSSPAANYCAYAQLDSVTTKSFCVDTLGFAGEIFFPTLSCPSAFSCAFRECPDFNDNTVVDCSNDARDPGCPAPGTGTCPGYTSMIAGSDFCCLVLCFGTTPSGAQPSCGTGGCTPCPDTDPDGPGPLPLDGNRGPECLAVYDANRDNLIDVNDIFNTGELLGKTCQ